MTATIVSVGGEIMVLLLPRLQIKLSQSNILQLSPPEECNPLGSTW